MIRVMLINDYIFISNLVAISLEGQEDIEVVKICTPEDDIMAAIGESKANVVLISGDYSTDVSIDLVRKIDEYDELIIMVLGLNESKEEIVPFLEAGANGYILKGATIEEFIESLYKAYHGEAAISPKIARILIEHVNMLAAEVETLDASIVEEVSLTRREVEVLGLIKEGFSNNQIAERMHVEVGTVKNHVHAILNKLEVGSRKEAVKYLGVMKRK